MRRRLLTIAIFLLVGAMVNVGVAWGCAVIWPGYYAIYGGIDRDWPHGVPQGWPAPEVVNEYRGFGWAFETFFSAPDTPRWSRGVYAYLSRAGWPAVTLKALRWKDRGAGVDDGGWAWHINLDNGKVAALPLRPIWPGFAVNSLFYAAILWLAIPGPFALRRLIRRRRGLCPACAYDLRHGEHEACPECGLAA